MTTDRHEPHFAAVVGMKRHRFAPFGQTRGLIIRDGLLRIVRPDGTNLVQVPVTETVVYLSRGHLVRLDGPGTRVWLWGTSNVQGVPTRLAEFVTAEGGIVGPLAEAARGFALGSAIQEARGSKILVEVLCHLGAQRVS